MNLFDYWLMEKVAEEEKQESFAKRHKGKLIGGGVASGLAAHVGLGKWNEDKILKDEKRIYDKYTEKSGPLVVKNNYHHDKYWPLKKERNKLLDPHKTKAWEYKNLKKKLSDPEWANSVDSIRERMSISKKQMQETSKEIGPKIRENVLEANKHKKEMSRLKPLLDSLYEEKERHFKKVNVNRYRNLVRTIKDVGSKFLKKGK